MESVIVIGAGAAGLMAAYELSKKGKTVTVLEANGRIGGRIYTVDDPSFSTPVEIGAEFIHGNMPSTMQLLKEADINYYQTKGRMVHIEKGRSKKQNEIGDDWGKLMKQMKMLENDMPLLAFLNAFFSDDKYKELRRSVQQFAEGFDLADLSDASTIALYKEWENEMGKQYRIEGGYRAVTDHLAAVCRNNGCTINLNCCVKKINWSKGQVNVITMCSQYFAADKIVIAVPLSVLRESEASPDYVEFAPPVDQHRHAAKEIGFGTVIKIILQFDENFWNDATKNIGFIFMREAVPTWWTQSPKDSAVLTGWLGGPGAAALKNVADDVILEMGLRSLASAFAKPFGSLQKELMAYKIANWSVLPHVYGGYSYNTLGSDAAKKFLNQAVENTIFFAGEGLSENGFTGTVEAALMSGRQAALKILQQ